MQKVLSAYAHPRVEFRELYYPHRIPQLLPTLQLARHQWLVWTGRWHTRAVWESANAERRGKQNLKTKLSQPKCKYTEAPSKVRHEAEACRHRAQEFGWGSSWNHSAQGSCTIALLTNKSRRSAGSADSEAKVSWFSIE